MTTDLVAVPIGVCPCPGAPHGDGDIVYLAPVLSMAGGMAARSAIIEGFTDEIAAQEAFAGIWLRHGVRDWTFLDEDGDRIPVSEQAALDLLPWAKGGRLVADKADELYATDALAPFQEAIKQLERSRRGPTPKAATSPRPSGSSSTRRSTPTRPSPSSTTTSAADTAKADRSAAS